MSKVPKFARPDRLPLHHTPNVLPVSHKRDDYDFDYADGVWGPIRLSTHNNCLAPSDLPPMIWCRRHGWEKEVIPGGETFMTDDGKGGKAWGYRCPTCRKARSERNWSMEFYAIRSLRKHMADAHAGTVPFRLHGEPKPNDPHPAEVGAREVGTEEWQVTFQGEYYSQPQRYATEHSRVEAMAAAADAVHAGHVDVRVRMRHLSAWVDVPHEVAR